MRPIVDPTAAGNVAPSVQTGPVSPLDEMRQRRLEREAAS